jgi:hypothetical protein
MDVDNIIRSYQDYMLAGTTNTASNTVLVPALPEITTGHQFMMILLAVRGWERILFLLRRSESVRCSMPLPQVLQTNGCIIMISYQRYYLSLIIYDKGYQ